MTPGRSPSSAASSLRSSRRWPAPRSPTSGEARSGSRATGPAPSASTATTGLAWAGGYVGDGVSTTNLAGRTLADLITGADTPITHLPWVGHRSRRWEPEPLRWLGINLALALPAGADRAESRTGKPARMRTAALDRLTGH